MLKSIFIESFFFIIRKHFVLVKQGTQWTGPYMKRAVVIKYESNSVLEPFLMYS